jgi:hypothetical protein
MTRFFEKMVWLFQRYGTHSGRDPRFLEETFLFFVPQTQRVINVQKPILGYYVRKVRMRLIGA